MASYPCAFIWTSARADATAIGIFFIFRSPFLRSDVYGCSCGYNVIVRTLVEGDL
jgi:hypothetical protein